MDEQIQEQSDSTENSGGFSLSRVLGVLLLLVAVLVALYLIIGYLAWQSGETLRMQREEDLRVQQLDRQVSIAQEDIANGEYNLALRRLEWVLEKDPDNEEAAALRRQAEAAIKTALTPEAPPTATPLPEPTIDLNEETDIDRELVRLRRLYDREQWNELLPAALTLQQQFPNFQRLETDRFLYDSYLNLGVQLLQGNQIEKGLNYLAEAERLGDLSQEALDYRLWANLYLEGIAYYGVNWGVSASVFRELCLSAPFYQNACDKFYESLVNYGDQYLFSQDFCPAVEIYREARQYGSSGELNNKLSDAAEGCAAATPTPAVISGTLPVTGTELLPLPETNE
jgi:hypothetical protein